MKLRSGSKVGPYEIVAPLGAGGMGEVYRARDLRLAPDRPIIALDGASFGIDYRLRLSDLYTVSGVQ